MNTNTMEEIEKIYQILISNHNKISQLLNTQNNNSMIYGYLAGFDIDIKTIISLLDRIKFDVNRNMNKDIIICGDCDCCQFCDNSTNNCSENNINLSSDNSPNNNKYIKEIINCENDKNNDFNLNNYRTYQYSNINDNNNKIPNMNCLNIPDIEDRFKNSSIMKSKRFHVNKSSDNMKIINTSSPIRKAKIIRHYNLTESNNLNNEKRKLNKNQIFLNKLSIQPKEIINRFKSIYGIDIEQRLLNNEISDTNLNEMENILNKITSMSIWGKKENNSKNKKNKIKFKYNPIQEKVKLKQAITNKQAQYREFPRGWYSTKEYFINNGTAINNDKAFL